MDEYLWLMSRAQYKPVIEYCGGTEIGGGFATGSLLQNQSLAAFSTPAMGCSLFILGDDGLPIVSTSEKSTVVVHMNATSISFPSSSCLHDAIRVFCFQFLAIIFMFA